MLGRLAVRYPEVPVIFAGSRKFAEEWTYRFLGDAVADRIEPTWVAGNKSLRVDAADGLDVIFEPDTLHISKTPASRRRPSCGYKSSPSDNSSVDRRTVGAMIVPAPVDSKGASRTGSLGSLVFRGKSTKFTFSMASLNGRRRRAPRDQAPHHAANGLEFPLSS